MASEPAAPATASPTATNHAAAESALGTPVAQPENRERWPTWIILLLALGLALRVREYLAGRSLWLDESLLALELIEKTPRELLGPLGFSQGAPAGFLLGEKAIAELVGYSEFALRFLPLVFGVLALLVFVPLARRTVAADAVGVALILVVVADGLVYYAAEVKQYSVDVFVSVFLLAAAAPLARGAPFGRRTSLLGLAVAPLLWLSHAAVLVATGCGIVVVVAAVIARRRDRLLRVAPIVAAWAIMCLAVVATAPDYDELRAEQARAPDAFVGQAEGLSDTGWVVTFGGSVAVALGLPAAGSLALLGKILGAVAAVGFLGLLRRDAVAAALLGAPVAITSAISALDLYPLYARTLLFLVPVAALLLGQGVVEFASLAAHRYRRIVLTLATLLVIALPAAKAVERFVDRPVGQDLKPALTYVRDHWQPRDTLYLSGRDQHVYLYYTRCGCFDLDAPSGGRLPTALVRFGGDGSLHHATFGSRTPKLVLGGRESDVEARLDDVDRLRGRDRAWILTAHFFEGEGPEFREEALPRRLDRLGRRLDAFVAIGGAAYLYEFVDRP